jgi:hypothetical protein
MQEGSEINFSHVEHLYMPLLKLAALIEQFTVSLEGATSIDLISRQTDTQKSNEGPRKSDQQPLNILTGHCRYA